MGIGKVFTALCWFFTAATLAGPALADPGSAVRTGKQAKPIQRANPNYPKPAQLEHREGWTLASFVVNPDGTTSDIFIEDSFGGKDFEKASLKAISKWRYEPAELNGEKVQQCHSQVILSYEIAGIKKGARRGFRSKFKRASDVLLNKGDLEEGEEMVDALRPTNLYESSYVSLLRAQIARIRKQPVQQAYHLHYASISDGAFLDKELYPLVLAERYALAVNANDFFRARHRFAELKKLDPDGIPPNIIATNEKVEAALAGEGIVRAPGELPALEEGQTGHTRWGRGLVRRMVGIEEVEGTIDHVDLRCDFHRSTWEVKPGRAWRIPEEWGQCYAHVFGEPGTTFELLEYPASFASES